MSQKYEMQRGQEVQSMELGSDDEARDFAERWNYEYCRRESDSACIYSAKPLKYEFILENKKREDILSSDETALWWARKIGAVEVYRYNGDEPTLVYKKPDPDELQD